ncbi:MAG: DUF4760 domain-containing protein [Defluviitaleaceae bacterium]|nr:DUF4760 domain-containing protein [Defluviitaleaceae bacterium]
MQLLQTILIAVGAIVAVVTLAKDHVRRKRQATLDFNIAISKEIYEIHSQIEIIFMRRDIEPDDDRYKNNIDIQDKIARLLSLYERTAIGIRYNVFDKNIFMEITGRHTLRWYKRLKKLIEFYRTEEDANPNAYMEFERLAHRMDKKYNQTVKRRFCELIITKIKNFNWTKRNS